MYIIRIRDKNGKIIEIPGFRGPKPVKGVDYFTPEEIAEFLNEITKVSDGIATKEITPVETYPGKYFNSNGDLVADSNTTISYLFPVVDGETILATEVLAYGVRAVVAFDADKKLIKEIPTNSKLAKENLVIDTTGFSYLGMSTQSDYNFSVKYKDIYCELQEPLYQNAKDRLTVDLAREPNIGNYLDAKITVDRDAFTSGGYIYWDDRIYAGELYAYSPYIEVLENQEVELKYFASAAQVTAYFYDANKVMIGKRMDETKGASVVSRKFVVPLGTKYIRYNTTTDNLYRTDLRYTAENIDRHYLPISIIEGFRKDTFGRAMRVFEKAASKPMITFIDDDILSIAGVERYHDLCVELGIKGGYAVITDNLDRIEGMTEKLLGYEREGFASVVHCSKQSGHIDNGEGMLSSCYSAENRDLEKCEEDLVNALQKMNKAGFTDYKFWCTPYGVCDEDIQSLARKWGMNCLISSGRDEYETTEAKHGRYALRRVSFESADGTSGSVAQIKNHIDNAVAENGWLLITTHMGEPGWAEATAQDRFREIVNYAKTKGMDVKAINEAWRIREPIYRLYESF